jgi:hypothetical protein
LTDLTIYINGHFFDSLSNTGHYSDRPEFYREHEKSLWTIYQLSKLEDIEIVFTNRDREIIFRTNNSIDLESWIKHQYPNFVEQIKKPIYTKYPHPNDKLNPIT